MGEENQNGMFVATVRTNDPVVKQVLSGLDKIDGTTVEIVEDEGPTDRGVNRRLGKIKVIVKTEPLEEMLRKYPPKTEKEKAAENLPDPDPVLEATLVNSAEPEDLRERMKELADEYRSPYGKTLLELVLTPPYVSGDTKALENALESGQLVEGEGKNPIFQDEKLGDIEIDEEANESERSV